MPKRISPGAFASLFSEGIEAEPVSSAALRQRRRAAAFASALAEARRLARAALAFARPPHLAALLVTSAPRRR